MWLALGPHAGGTVAKQGLSIRLLQGLGEVKGWSFRPLVFHHSDSHLVASAESGGGVPPYFYSPLPGQPRSWVQRAAEMQSAAQPRLGTGTPLGLPGFQHLEPPHHQTPGCPRSKCQSCKGLRCREMGSQEGPWVQQEPAPPNPVSRSSSLSWASFGHQQLLGSGPRKDSQGSHFPPLFSAHVPVTRRA